MYNSDVKTLCQISFIKLAVFLDHRIHIQAGHLPVDLFGTKFGIQTHVKLQPSSSFLFRVIAFIYTRIGIEKIVIEGGLKLLLFVRDEMSSCQVVWLVAIAIATANVREDPFQIGGIRWKSGFYFILGASLRREKSQYQRHLEAADDI
ncbi:hypothetical protein AVEN_126966-1 [Araneus ventricosus]|uniref:Uncharacterized protein n=1 Tax=Araneus ventricosus TaxID=182803 RepID=A0A4Y2EBG4_ARAVE|nr:hypothetical protein AVEN_126966-1 [Araneus ventricosus]